MSRVAISFSNGIRRIKGIERFVAVDRVIGPGGEWSADDDVVVLVWGRKPHTRKALAFAEKNDLPVLYLEDGFIRTCSEDAHSRLSYSLLVDQKGVYYDSAEPNALEDFLNSSEEDFLEIFTESAHELSIACREIMVENNITKYNYCSDFDAPERLLKQSLVLVVDQTVDDASVRCGGMDAARFMAMLDAAISENPDAHVMVKTHPDVIAGKRSGYLTKYAASKGVELLSENVNPVSLLKHCDKVYVGTSQMGMEALMLDAEVVVFGKPYYAGWGLTDDRHPIEHRVAERSLDELFFAAYLWYPRYLNPITMEQWTLPECLQHVLLQKRMFAKNARNFTGVGITPWKRRYIAQYLRSPEGSVRFVNENRLAIELQRKDCDALVTWSYRIDALAHGNEAEINADIFRIEDGFVRSQGLGTDFNAPASLVIDSSGLYFNPKKPSDLENLLNHAECSLEQIWRAKRLISLILSGKLSKYNVGSEDAIDWNPGKDQKTILVVGQVESDASIRYGCQDVNSNAELLLSVRNANPNAWIVYKPHPDVLSGSRPGAVPATVLENTIDRLENEANIIDCIDSADELHTMTSLSGFEALLRGKTVVTYGSPFYAGWGLTTDLQPMHTRRRQRTLEELVYFSLIVYPRYMDIDTGEFASPEDIVNKIRTNHMNNKTMNWPVRQIARIANVYRGLSYAP